MAAVWTPGRPAAAAAATRDEHRIGCGRRRAPTTQASTRTLELDSGAVAVAPGQRRPKGIIHFLGGAFVGAVPLPTYSLLIERLAEGGYTVVATPYSVTFQHLECAAAVHSAFETAVAELRGTRGSWAAPLDTPVHGVGHSNGSLLHLLIGSTQLGPSGGGGGGGGLRQRSSNVLMSYNNFEVGTAIPVPLGSVTPAVQQLRGGGRLAAGLQQAVQQAAAAAAGLPVPPAQQKRVLEVLKSLQAWDPALVQIGSVFDEVGDGFQDFSPSPAEARQLISTSYCVPETLLVKFQNDNTDETPQAAAMLNGPSSSFSSSSSSSSSSGAYGGAGGGGAMQRRAETLVLPGSHVTPCGPAARRVPAGEAFGPREALAMAAQAVISADTNRLADRVLAYLNSRS